jgi:hypothetical protein
MTIGSAEFEERMEHFLAYSLESRGLLTSPWHGDALWTTIRIASVLQGWPAADVDRLCNFVDELGVPAHTAVLNEPSLLEDAVVELPDFCRAKAHTNSYCLVNPPSGAIVHDAVAAGLEGNN